MTALLDRRISENNLPRRQPKCLDNAANVARVSRATNRFLKRRDTSTVGKKVFFSPQRDRFRGGKKKHGEKPVRFPEIFTQEAFDANSASMLFPSSSSFSSLDDIRYSLAIKLEKVVQLEIDSESIII